MRVREALNILFEQTALEIVYETHETRDFVEVVGTAGGDAVRYRVYNDGTVFRK